MAKRVSLFKLLRRDLGPRIAAAGFREVPQGASDRGHILTYFRQDSGYGSLGFWFQRNVKSSFVDAVGSSFTVEFFRSLDDPYDLRNRERIYFLLNASELEEMRDLQNQVIRRLPPIESVLEPWEVTTFGSSVESKRQVIAEPFNPRHEVWMRYRDEVDILSWTSFIGRLLPVMPERFEIAKPQSNT